MDLPEAIVEMLKTELGSISWNETFEMEYTDPMYHQTVFAQTFPSGLSGDSFFVIFYSNSSANHGYTTYYDPQPDT